jgi:hypothetical protein
VTAFLQKFIALIAVVELPITLFVLPALIEYKKMGIQTATTTKYPLISQ